jgi:Ser/Thr protein kinase RdoA (MazF antagonist)
MSDAGLANTRVYARVPHMIAEQKLTSILAHFALGAVRKIEPIASGIINNTYRVHTENEVYILQRLGSIFTAKTALDSMHVAQHLEAQGLPTPIYRTTASGTPYVIDEEDRVWRVMTAVDGETYDVMPDVSYAREAGRVLASFHHAMKDFDPKKLSSPLRLHQTPQIIAAFHERLPQILTHATSEAERERYHSIVPLLEAHSIDPTLDETIVHGDPKISNIMFKNSKAICMIDLDTCMRHSSLVDIGDALRSWCRLSEEDNTESYFSLDAFREAMRGYLTERPLPAALYPAICRSGIMITLELAARFANDIVDDSYFGWNYTKFTSRREHNRVRVETMVAYAQDTIAHLEAMQRVLSDENLGQS